MQQLDTFSHIKSLHGDLFFHRRSHSVAKAVLFSVVSVCGCLTVGLSMQSLEPSEISSQNFYRSKILSKARTCSKTAAFRRTGRSREWRENLRPLLDNPGSAIAARRAGGDLSLTSVASPLSIATVSFLQLQQPHKSCATTENHKKGIRDGTGRNFLGGWLPSFVFTSREYGTTLDSKLWGWATSGACAPPPQPRTRRPLKQ